MFPEKNMCTGTNICMPSTTPSSNKASQCHVFPSWKPEFNAETLWGNWNILWVHQGANKHL